MNTSKQERDSSGQERGFDICAGIPASRGAPPIAVIRRRLAWCTEKNMSVE